MKNMIKREQRTNRVKTMPSGNILREAKKLLQLGLVAVIAMTVPAACSSSGDDEPETGKVTLSADVSSISANGTEKVTFTVTFNSENVTSAAKIYDVETGSSIAGNVFATNESGTYKFYAIYEGVKSEPVTVTAMELLALTPSSDKFTPDGTDVITFTVKQGGTDVTASSKIKNVTSGEYLSGTTFSSTSTAAVSFIAEYGEYKSTELTLTPKSFYHRVGIFRITGTWCGPCYVLAMSMNSVMEQIGDRMILVNLHISDVMANNESANIAGKFVASSIPDCRFDLKEKMVGSYPASTVKSKVETHAANPSTTGISATASVSGNTATLKVTVRTSETKNYYLGVMLLEDGIEGTQYTGSSTIAYTHNEVFRKLVSGDVYGDDLGEIKAGGTVEKTYTADLSSYNAGNCYFMIYSLYDSFISGSSAAVVDNSVYCGIGESVTYKFED